jgi:hypothetical protein
MIEMTPYFRVPIRSWELGGACGFAPRSPTNASGSSGQQGLTSQLTLD